MNELRVRAVEPGDLGGLFGLFERTGSPCFCRWWHFTGDTNGWLDRCANRPEENRDEMTRALREGSLTGVIARAEDSLVGWMKICPAVEVPKLFEQRVQKGLPCLGGDRRGVWVIGCFLVDESWRKKRVADALLEEGIALARGCGATSLEAFPRRAEGVAAEQLWTGPMTVFERAGFRVASELYPYPVLRLDLSERA